MKSSNNYLLAAAVVLLATLTAYNMALRAEYQRGDYKNLVRDYVSLPLRGFTEVAVPASHVVSVKIEPGPFRVRLSPQAQGYVHVRQQGQRLVVTADFPTERQYFGQAETVLISCPRLAGLSVDAFASWQGKPLVYKHYGRSATVVVKGFAQDSLAVHQDRGSRVELVGNQLRHLRAVAGPTPGSHGLLQLQADNRIAAADLTLSHQSELALNRVRIPQLRHQLADSVQVTLTGAALRSLP